MNPIASTASSYSAGQVTSFIQQRLNAPERNGRPNLFQIVDKLNISDQAKQQVEQGMAQDMLSQQPAQPSTSSTPTMSGDLFAQLQSLGSTASPQGDTSFLNAAQQLKQGK